MGSAAASLTPVGHRTQSLSVTPLLATPARGWVWPSADFSPSSTSTTAKYLLPHLWS